MMPNGRNRIYLPGRTVPGNGTSSIRRLQDQVLAVETAAHQRIEELTVQVQAAEVEAHRRIAHANHLERNADTRLQGIDPPPPAYPDHTRDTSYSAGPTYADLQGQLNASETRNLKQTEQITQLNRQNARLARTLSYAEGRIKEQDQQLDHQEKLLKERSARPTGSGQHQRPMPGARSGGQSSTIPNQEHWSSRPRPLSRADNLSRGDDRARRSDHEPRQQRSGVVDRNGERMLQDSARRTSRNDDYGPDAFEGADLEKLEKDAIRKIRRTALPSHQDPDYGPDPFVGVDLDKLERQAMDRSRDRNTHSR